MWRALEVAQSWHACPWKSDRPAQVQVLPPQPSLTTTLGRVVTHRSLSCCFSSVLLSLSRGSDDSTDLWLPVPSPSLPVEQERHRGDWEQLGRGRVPPMSGACSHRDTRAIGHSPYGLHSPEVRHEANSKALRLMTPMILCTQSRSSQMSF